MSVQVSEGISAEIESIRFFRAELQSYDNKQLLSELCNLNDRERKLKVRILFYLREIDRRRLYLELGFSSMFDFCTKHLRYSRSSACRRIKAARCMGRYPEAALLLQSGEINITTLSMVSGILDDSNYQDILEKIRNRSRRDVEMLISGMNPQKVIRDRVRPVCVFRKTAEVQSTPTGGSSSERKKSVKSEKQASSTPDVGSSEKKLEVERRFEVRFSASKDFMNKLKKAKSLLSTRHPKGINLELLFDELLEEYLDNNDPERRVIKNPVPEKAQATHTRHIPQRIKDLVYKRDGGRCSFVSKNGRRCNSTWNLQYDHIIPYARGGDNSPENLRLLCARHNRLMAEREFGKNHIESCRSREP
ncbi:MAG: HNH endonuclease signature motif containing protein [Candidatus Krumholzibacteriales bacterium]